MINLKILTGQPIIFEKIKIYPPTINDISKIEDIFPAYEHMLTMPQIELTYEFKKKQPDQEPPTVFEYLLVNCAMNKDFMDMFSAAMAFFTHERVLVVPNLQKILIGELTENTKTVEDLQFLDENNFFDFQNCVRQSLGLAVKKKPNPNMSAGQKRFEELNEKREYLASKKSSKDGSGISLGTMVASICCMGIGITPLNVGEMSYASLKSLMPMLQSKAKYEMDIRSIQAGADPKKVKPEYWIKNYD